MERQTELQEIQWLAESAKDLPGHGYTGYSPEIGEASTWILHAMYETKSDTPDITHDEWHHLQVEGGMEEPLFAPGLNPESLTVLGIPIGRTTRPESNYKRLRWSELASREKAPMASSGVPPCFRWFPYNSWPLRIRPPAEGSIDRESFHLLVRHIIATSPSAGASECFVLYAPLSTGDMGGPPILYHGQLAELSDLYDHHDFNAGPTNIWTRDRSWFTYTDSDLMATRVSGSLQLVNAIVADSELETTSYP
ncbi:MAG: hypothetical protein ABSA07_10100 [Acidimicrobiales bacterium]